MVLGAGSDTVSFIQNHSYEITFSLSIKEAVNLEKGEPLKILSFEAKMAERKKTEPITIEGYSGFLFLNGKGYPMTNAYYTATFYNLTKKYNKYHEDSLPKITPHILRHTFCTRLANRNMNPKSLQYIMGHSNISITFMLMRQRKTSAKPIK